MATSLARKGIVMGTKLILTRIQERSAKLEEAIKMLNEEILLNAYATSVLEINALQQDIDFMRAEFVRRSNK